MASRAIFFSALRGAVLCTVKNMTDSSVFAVARFVRGPERRYEETQASFATRNAILVQHTPTRGGDYAIFAGPRSNLEQLTADPYCTRLVDIHEPKARNASQLHSLHHPPPR
jgi:hypothetical protein